MLYNTLTGKDSTCKTPHIEELFISSQVEKLLDPSQEKKNFLSIVMSLMYIARLTRPDIILPVSYLATRAHICTQEDWIKLIRVLRYLKGTKTRGITIKCEDPTLWCHCDASYAVHHDGRSHTGFVIYMGKHLSYVLTKSTKQKTGSLSSTDAEIIALVDALKVIVWLKYILIELDIFPVRAPKIMQDNQSGMLMVTEPSKFKRSKHILTKINYARDLFASKCIEIEYLSTTEMSADLLTKPLSGSLFTKHRDMLMGTFI